MTKEKHPTTPKYMHDNWTSLYLDLKKQPQSHFAPQPAVQSAVQLAVQLAAQPAAQLSPICAA
jgi:hypothetical protein